MDFASRNAGNQAMCPHVTHRQRVCYMRDMWHTHQHCGWQICSHTGNVYAVAIMLCTQKIAGSSPSQTTLHFVDIGDCSYQSIVPARPSTGAVMMTVELMAGHACLQIGRPTANLRLGYGDITVFRVAAWARRLRERCSALTPCK